MLRVLICVLVLVVGVALPSSEAFTVTEYDDGTVYAELTPEARIAYEDAIARGETLIVFRSGEVSAKVFMTADIAYCETDGYGTLGFNRKLCLARLSAFAAFMTGVQAPDNTSNCACVPYENIKLVDPYNVTIAGEDANTTNATFASGLLFTFSDCPADADLQGGRSGLALANLFQATIASGIQNNSVPALNISGTYSVYQTQSGKNESLTFYEAAPVVVPDPGAVTSTGQVFSEGGSTGSDINILALALGLGLGMACLLCCCLIILSPCIGLITVLLIIVVACIVLIPIVTVILVVVIVVVVVVVGCVLIVGGAIAMVVGFILKKTVWKSRLEEARAREAEMEAMGAPGFDEDDDL